MLRFLRCSILIKNATRKISNSTTATNHFDVCVIGSGPGGYVAAIKSSQLGLKTACVERYASLGGTCLNVGCIPSKSLLYNSHVYHMAKSGQLQNRGVKCSGVSLDLAAMMKHKEQAVKGLTQGVSILFKSNKITRFHGTATILNPGEIEVKQNSTTSEVIKAKKIIIATGSSVLQLPGIKVNEQNIVSSTGALSLTKVPQRMLVIGAGAIGLELGSVWCRLGSKVTIVEMMSHVGGTNIDSEVSSSLLRLLKKQGLQFKLESRVQRVDEQQAGNTIKVQCQSGKGVLEELVCDVLLMSAGRRPCTDSLGLERLGVNVDKVGRVMVNENFETNVPDIYAIGDCIRGPMLAHKAEDEGIMCAEFIAGGKQPHLNFDHVPNVIYTHPEVAWLGKTEEALKSEGVKYNVGKFPMVANSRAKTIGDVDGFCKVLSDAESGKLVGVHMINSVAGDLIAEAVVAMDNGLTVTDLSRSCHAHPTWSEAFKEANLHASCGKAINNLN